MTKTLEESLLDGLNRVSLATRDICDRCGEHSANRIIADAFVLALAAMEEHLRFAVNEYDGVDGCKQDI